VQNDAHAMCCDLPGCLAAGEPAADDVDRVHSHGGSLRSRGHWDKCPGRRTRNASGRELVVPSEL
jgi:hypothetical protein